MHTFRDYSPNGRSKLWHELKTSTLWIILLQARRFAQGKMIDNDACLGEFTALVHAIQEKTARISPMSECQQPSRAIKKEVGAVEWHQRRMHPRWQGEREDKDQEKPGWMCCTSIQHGPSRVFQTTSQGCGQPRPRTNLRVLWLQQEATPARSHIERLWTVSCDGKLHVWQQMQVRSQDYKQEADCRHKGETQTVQRRPIGIIRWEN